jgi:hypothetical protein
LKISLGKSLCTISARGVSILNKVTGSAKFKHDLHLNGKKIRFDPLMPTISRLQRFHSFAAFGGLHSAPLLRGLFFHESTLKIATRVRRLFVFVFGRVKIAAATHGAGQRAHTNTQG